MITVGRNGSQIVIRNLDNGSVIRLDGGDVEGFSMFVEMLVDELNDLDPGTNYHLEEYEPDGEDG